MAIEGVILDVDGTLVASNDIHAQAWVEAFSNYGYEIPFEQVRPLIGMGGDQVIPRLVATLNGKEGVGKQIADRRKELILSKFSNGLAPTLGARELVKKLRDDGLQLVIASSATDSEMELLLKVAEVDGLISEFTTSSDAEASKPEPDIVEAALHKAQLQPDRTIMLGDTPYDIEAAAKAGVGVIAFRTGGFSDEQLQGAIAIYDHPADLLRHYPTSPLVASTTTVMTTNDMMTNDMTTNDMKVNDMTTNDMMTNDMTTNDMTTNDMPANDMSASEVMLSRSTNESVEESWHSIQAQVSAFFANITSSATTFFRNNRSLLTTLGWVLLALLSLRLLLGALDAFDDIPLVSPLLKLIGFVYVVRFVWRFLLRQHDRKELMQTLSRAKEEIFGNQS